MPKHHINKKVRCAQMYLYGGMTVHEVAKQMGVSAPSVSTWAKKLHPERWEQVNHRAITRNLLMAQEILEARPTIRVKELAELVEVTDTTIRTWNKKGMIELDLQCTVCGEETTTKYCRECVDKDWPRIQNVYGLTLEQLRSMSDTCEICGVEGSLAVDHNHDTGKYRGMLCTQCNTALGLSKENIKTLINMIIYIIKHK